MKHILTPFLAILPFFLTSCSSDDDNHPVISPYAGYYTVLQAESDTAVDLDNDGIAHTDLMVEIEYFRNVPYDIFLDERANGYKSMNFYIPCSQLMLPDDPEYFYVSYPHGAMGAYYEYSYATNQITFEDVSYNENDLKWGVPQSVEILDATTLKCTMLKQYYDYQINDMRSILLTLVFQKQAE